MRRLLWLGIGLAVGALVFRAVAKKAQEGIIELLLITTVPTMVVAEQGMPSLWLMVATVIARRRVSADEARALLSEKPLREVL